MCIRDRNTDGSSPSSSEGFQNKLRTGADGGGVLVEEAAHVLDGQQERLYVLGRFRLRVGDVYKRQLLPSCTCASPPKASFLCLKLYQMKKYLFLVLKNKIF